MLKKEELGTNSDQGKIKKDLWLKWFDNFCVLCFCVSSVYILYYQEGQKILDSDLNPKQPNTQQALGGETHEENNRQEEMLDFNKLKNDLTEAIDKNQNSLQMMKSLFNKDDPESDFILINYLNKKDYQIDLIEASENILRLYNELNRERMTKSGFSSDQIFGIEELKKSLVQSFIDLVTYDFNHELTNTYFGSYLSRLKRNYAETNLEELYQLIEIYNQNNQGLPD